MLNLQFKVESEPLSLKRENRHRHMILFHFHEEKCLWLIRDLNLKPIQHGSPTTPTPLTDLVMFLTELVELFTCHFDELHETFTPQIK